MKSLDNTSLEPTNQPSIKEQKVYLTHQIRWRDYKTLETSVIYTETKVYKEDIITP